MKQEYKTIVAIETTINGRTAYISGHSHRFDNMVIPQFNTDPVHAKEFDTMEEANIYLPTISNPHHRMYTVIAIEIPVIKDLKKYDRDKKKIQRSDPSSRKKIITDALLVFIACIVLVSCSKSQVAPPKQTADAYKLFIEQYTLDTILFNRYIWWQDTLSNPKEKIKIDTLKPKWYRICDSNNKPTHLEYVYYTRNGIKLQ